MTSEKSNTLDISRNKGVLHPTKSRANYHLEQYPPSENLLPFIEQFWHVEWNLDKQKPHTQQNLPQPNIHITFENDKTIVYGPVKQRFTHTLSGKGSIFGIKFSTGGFTPMTKHSMSKLADTQSELKTYFNEERCLDALNINQESNIKRKIQLAEIFLTKLFFNNETTKYKVGVERHLEQISLIKSIASLIETTPSITKVEQLCSIFNISSRTLQRLFQNYVGISPKWLIRKYRINEILVRLENTNSETTDWQKIVLDLEYVDQAHLINDFKYFIGYTPLQYVNLNT